MKDAAAIAGIVLAASATAGAVAALETCVLRVEGMR